MNCQKCKSWEEMYDRCENEKRALAAERDGADAVIKTLKENVRAAEQALREIINRKSPVTIAQQLKRWRRVRGLSQSQAAPLLGVPIKTLQNWEVGRRTPRGLALSALLKLLNP